MKKNFLSSLLVVAVLASCGAEPGENTTVRLALDLPVAGNPLGIDTPLRDDLGLYDLSAHPIFLRLEVSANDLEEPALVDWPDDQDDLIAPAESVLLELEVESGDARQLDAVLFLVTDGTLAAYRADPSPTLNLSPGQVADVDLTLAELEYGTVSGSAEAAAAVLWVDMATDVILGRFEPDADGQFIAAPLPILRSLYPVWEMLDGSLTPDPARALAIPTAGVTAPLP
jgi:hypothetical protein